MNPDDFRDYMLLFLFLRYLSDNYEETVKKNWVAITGNARVKSNIIAEILTLYVAQLKQVI